MSLVWLLISLVLHSTNISQLLSIYSLVVQSLLTLLVNNVH